MDTNDICTDQVSEQRLVDWYHSPQGVEVLSVLRAELEELLSTRFGYLAVQVGVGALEPAFVTPCRVRQHAVISALPVPGTIQACAEALPVASESADLLMLVHALELASDPYQLLRELERVLVPEGEAIVISFNPLSVWGAWSWLSGRLWSDATTPWQGRFYTTHRLKDWFQVLGFEVTQVRRRLYRPPSWRGWLGQRLGWVEKIGPRWLGPLGGVQIIVVRKRRSRLIPLKTRWRRPRRVLAGGIAEHTSRSLSGVDDRS